MKNFVKNIQRNRINYYLFLILLLAIVARFSKLTYQSLWFDELSSVTTSDPGNSLKEVIKHLKDNVHPPFYYILLNIWFKLTGYTEYAARFLSAFIGVLGVYGIYFLGKEFKNKLTGIFAALITATNYFHIYYSQDAKAYPLLFLLSVLSYLFYLRAVKNHKTKDFVLYAIFTIFLAYTHYYGLFVIFSQLIIALLIVYFLKPNKKFLTKAGFTILGILAGYSFWLPMFFKTSGTTLMWMDHRPFYIFGDYFYRYWGKDPFTTLLVLVLIGVFISYFYKTLKSRNPVFKKLIFSIPVVWLIIAYTTPFMLSYLRTPMLHFRYTTIAMPPLFIMIAFGITQIQRKTIRNLVVICLLLSTTINLLFFREYYTRKTKEQWREVVKDVVNSNHKGHKYSYWAKFYNFYFNLYNKNKAKDLNEINLVKSLQKVEEFWLLKAHKNKNMDGEVVKLKKVEIEFIKDNFICKEKFMYPTCSAEYYLKK